LRLERQRSLCQHWRRSQHRDRDGRRTWLHHDVELDRHGGRAGRALELERHGRRARLDLERHDHDFLFLVDHRGEFLVDDRGEFLVDDRSELLVDDGGELLVHDGGELLVLHDRLLEQRQPVRRVCGEPGLLRFLESTVLLPDGVRRVLHEHHVVELDQHDDELERRHVPALRRGRDVLQRPVRQRAERHPQLRRLRQDLRLLHQRPPVLPQRSLHRSSLQRRALPDLRVLLRYPVLHAGHAVLRQPAQPTLAADVHGTRRRHLPAELTALVAAGRGK
jgi:hypothetical protein